MTVLPLAAVVTTLPGIARVNTLIGWLRYPGSRCGARRRAMLLAIFAATAKIESCGFAPIEVGNSEPSAT